MPRLLEADAGNPAMLRAMRAHSDFAEHVPSSLLLVLQTSASGAHPLLLHFLGLTLLGGRISHAYGVPLRRAATPSGQWPSAIRCRPPAASRARVAAATILEVQ